ncbi:MAG: MgtC/SapB family protein [Rhodomicrobium sp.]
MAPAERRIDLGAGNLYVSAMIDWPDAVIRLTAATVIGGAIGLDREAHGKPTGVRTLGIVALGSALVVLASQHPGGADANAGSRVIQGVITGIGFLGAGVILRNPTGKRVHGLTTAAAIWLTACIGVACGLGAWPLVITSVVLAALILAFGRPIERAFVRRDRDEDDGPDKSAGAAPAEQGESVRSQPAGRQGG